MEHSKSAKQLLKTYYKGFAQNKEWDSVISDDFKFIGVDMANRTPAIGKQTYIEIIKRLPPFEDMRVKQMFIKGDSACAIVNYDWKFPNNKVINGDVVELWRVENSKLAALTIYFDTLTFQKNTK
jgi:ketosteroid isomerase-like protein